jgi:hypothetical protein
MVYAARTAGFIVLMLFLALLILSPDNGQAVIGWAIYGACYAVSWIFSSFQNAIAFFVILTLMIYFFRGGGGGHHN